MGFIPFAEVISINKQKFLAELGRLLTFMSEEDRQEALTLYAKMFDDVADEQALLQSLLSPTRQAVIIARAYDANARKLQARAKSRRDEDEDEENTPDFVLAILHVYEECVPLLPEEEVTEEDSVMADQFSLFEDDGRPTEESVYEETFVLHETPEVPSQPEDLEEALPEEEEALPPAPEAEAAAETAEDADEVDAFIANFSIQDNEIAEAPAKSTPLVLEERRVDSVDAEEEVRALVEDLLDEAPGRAAGSVRTAGPSAHTVGGRPAADPHAPVPGSGGRDDRRRLRRADRRFQRLPRSGRCSGGAGLRRHRAGAGAFAAVAVHLVRRHRHRRSDPQRDPSGRQLVL